MRDDEESDCQSGLALPPGLRLLEVGFVDRYAICLPERQKGFEHDSIHNREIRHVRTQVNGQALQVIE
jgi:hypothetical protein